MKIDQELIEKLAKLSKISLTPAEAKPMATNLSSILDYVDKLQEVDTTDILYNKASNNLAVPQPDIIEEFKDSEKIVKLFPDQEKGLVKVKSIKS